MITHFVYGAKVWGCSDTFRPYLYSGKLCDKSPDGVFTILAEGGIYRYAHAENIFYNETEACIRAAEIGTWTINAHYRRLKWFVERQKSSPSAKHLMEINDLLCAIENVKTNWDVLKKQYGELLPTFEELRD